MELCRASINLLTQIAYSVNKNIKMSSFKSSESIQKKEGGPDRSVSDKQSSSVTLNDLAMKARNQRTNGPVNAHLISWPTLVKHKAYKT